MKGSCKITRLICICLFIFTFSLSPIVWANPEGVRTEEDKSMRPVKHVIILVSSGVGIDAMRNTYTPTFNELVKDSVKLERAVGVYPPTNPSSLASLVSGATPGRHGLVKPLQKFRSETIFQVFQSQGMSTMIVAGIEEEVAPILPGFKHKVVIAGGTDKAITDQGIEQWKNFKPFATLVVLPDPAKEAKKHGVASQAYLKAITESDRQIARWVRMVKEQGVYEDTLLIVTSDHGIAGRSKERDEIAADRELMLPLLMRGPKIKAGVTLPPARMIDVPATIAYVAGSRMPAQSEGDVLWNAILPNPNLSQEALHEKRVKDISQQNLELARSAYRLAEDKLNIDARVEDLQEQKRQMEAFTEEKEQVIASLERKVGLQRYLVAGIVAIAVIGFIVEYFVLRKRFLMFD